MGFHPELHHRRSIRLPDFDYRTAGAYFVTVCTYERRCIFDDPQFKAIAEEVWRTVAGTASDFLDDFVMMPNHVHGIIWITESDAVGAQQPNDPFTEARTRSNNGRQRSYTVAAPLHPAMARRVAPGSLGALVRAFKSATAKRMNNLLGTPGAPVWQRNYHEHVVRNDADLNRIRQYIRDNPLRWADDPENTALTSGMTRANLNGAALP